MLELLARTTGTRLVTSGQVLATDGLDGLDGLLLASITTCCLAHALVYVAMTFLKALLWTWRLWSLGLTNLQLRNLSTHENADNSIVYLIYHLVKVLHGLQLVDEQGILLLVRSIVYGVLEFIQQTQVLLPGIIDGVQDKALMEGGNNCLRLAYPAHQLI